MSGLYSPEQVQAMFPEGRRPALKRLIAKAKEAGRCCKLGRGIGLTEEHVRTLFAYITCSSSRSTPTGRRRQIVSIDFVNKKGRKVLTPAPQV